MYGSSMKLLTGGHGIGISSCGVDSVSAGMRCHDSASARAYLRDAAPHTSVYGWLPKFAVDVLEGCAAWPAMTLSQQLQLAIASLHMDCIHVVSTD